MTVYVDDMRAPYGRMIMCHMIADSDAELHAMARVIGVARRWFHRGHYNICLESRARAVAAGAVEITKREAAAMAALRRADGSLLDPACAMTLFRERCARRAQPEAAEGLMPLLAALNVMRLDLSDEKRTQAEMAEGLRKGGFDFQREVRLAPGDVLGIKASEAHQIVDPHIGVQSTEADTSNLRKLVDRYLSGKGAEVPMAARQAEQASEGDLFESNGEAA